MKESTRVGEKLLADYIVKNIIPVLKTGTILTLHGDLGAGKTTFTKHLLRELGYIKDVTSPTYTLEHVYELPDRRTICHLDLYRIPAGEASEEILQLCNGEEEHFLTIIEWAERVPEIMDYSHMNIELTIVSENERDISLTFSKK